jgi:hypothetical protein
MRYFHAIAVLLVQRQILSRLQVPRPQLHEAREEIRGMRQNGTSGPVSHEIGLFILSGKSTDLFALSEVKA